jgi:hypothetical protein
VVKAPWHNNILSYFGKMDKQLYMAKVDETFEKLYNEALDGMDRIGLKALENALNRYIKDNLKNLNRML